MKRGSTADVAPPISYAFCLALLILSTACGPSPVPATSVPATADRTTVPTDASTATAQTTGATPSVTPALATCEVSGPWQVELNVTGGFAGIERRVELDQTGRYEAKDEQSGQTVEGRAASDVMADVVGGLSSLCQAVNDSRPPVCADCFSYFLQAAIDGARYEVALSDANVTQSPAAPLIGVLVRLLQDALG